MALHADPAYFCHPYFGARRDLDRDSLRGKNRRVIALMLNGRSPKGLKLLDIGCDTGSLLVVARDEFEMVVKGVEVSPTAGKIAWESHGLDVVIGEITELGLPGNSFDLITLVDLIEHTADPLALLVELRRLLRKDGRIYIATSDHDATINSVGLLLYRMMGPLSWPLLEKLYIPYHEFYFTRQTLSLLVQQAGLRTIHHSTREFPLDEFGHGLLLKLGLVPIFILQRILNRQTLQELLAVKVA